MMRFRSRKLLSILSVTVATLILLVFALIPHHHHGGAVCMILEHCTQNVTEDQHRGHNGCNDVNHNKACLTETEFVASSNDQVKCKVSSCDSHDHAHIDHILPLLCVVVNNLTGNLYLPSEDHRYSEFIPTAESAYVGLDNGLRAPPVSFC